MKNEIGLSMYSLIKSINLCFTDYISFRKQLLRTYQVSGGCSKVRVKRFGVGIGIKKDVECHT